LRLLNRIAASLFIVGMARQARSAIKRSEGVSKAIAKKPAAGVLKRPASVLARAARAEKAARAAALSPLGGLKALLLGLERRPDRHEKAKNMLKRHLPWLNVEFFRATDGKSDVIPNHEVAKTWNTKCNALYGRYEDIIDKDGNIIYTAEQFTNPGVDYEFSPGERGCAHSHYRMWQHAEKAEGPTLILEDDVQVEFKRTGRGFMNGKVFRKKLELGMQEAAKKNADVLYLGWAGFREGNFMYLKGSRGPRNPVIRKAEYVWTTVAYVIWPAGARKLLEKAQPMDQPVDNFMGWESREGRLRSYVLLDDGDTDDVWAGGIVNQVDFTGDSDIKKSDGGEQGDDPTKFLAKQV